MKNDKPARRRTETALPKNVVTKTMITTELYDDKGLPYSGPMVKFEGSFIGDRPAWENLMAEVYRRFE